MADIKTMQIKDAVDYIKSQDILEILIAANVIDENDVSGRKIVCPFHDEKTPSLNFYDDSYYCFGCSASGDAISFVESIYDIGFIEALRLICEGLNIELKENKLINPFLKNSESSLSKRIKTSTLEAEWKRYLQEMTEASVDIQKNARAFYPLEVGYDKDISYYVFRYTSKTGKTLGFTKRRTFETEDKTTYPKWKHSKKNDSNITECATCYNLGDAIRPIRASKEVIFVEGPKDTIPFILNKRRNVLAISGTHHFQSVYEIIPKDCTNFILALDNDEAGIKGMVDIAKYLADKVSLESIYYIDFNGNDPYDYYYNISKDLPKKQPIFNLLSEDQLKELYQSSNFYNKELLVKSFSLSRAISWDASKSFFLMSNQEASKRKEKQSSEIERLLKSNDEKALKKLKIKYGIKID